MVERVRRPKQFDDLLNTLANLKEQRSVFPTYKDALVFAACLGLQRNKRVSFEKYSEPINLQIFSSDFDHMAMDVIAITAENNDPMIMATERAADRIRIFEEYACGGLEIIQNELNQGKLEELEEGLLQLVLAEQNENDILDDILDLTSI